jgi:hypothetical protein
MKCNCHPYSPFHWASNPRPSIFIRDIGFRATGVVVTEYGSHFSAEAEAKRMSKDAKEKEMIAYKQFGIYMRANPSIKPTKNKHET